MTGITYHLPTDRANWPELWRWRWIERAAIMEHHGRLTRDISERLAEFDVRLTYNREQIEKERP